MVTEPSAEAREQAHRLVNRWADGWPPLERLEHMADLAELIARALAEKDAALEEARAKIFEDVRAIIQEWEQAFPEAVFPSFTAETPDSELTRDCVGAAMGRHIARELLKQIDELARAPEWTKKEETE